MALSEFELIHRYFAAGRVPVAGPGVVRGIGDDCAILTVPPGCELAVSVDTLVSGVHFPADMAPREIGYRALAVNLSDLAAAGATPAWFTLALTLPAVDEAWLAEFAAGLAALAAEAGIALVGGDTTRGPLVITVQVAGHVATGRALARDGAGAGDLVCVTGTPGDAAAGLSQWGAPGADDYLRRRFLRPTPRLAEARLLPGLASACIDVSDGLLADLGHILEASGVGADVQVDEVPRSPALAGWPDPERALVWVLAGGDDYELCFTVPPDRRAELEQAFAAAGLAFAVIGHIGAQPGLRCFRRDGSRYHPAVSGYEHFA